VERRQEDGIFPVRVASKSKNSGRKRKNFAENLEKMKDVPLNQRSTLRSLSAAIDVPRTSLFRRLKDGDSIKRVSSFLKPTLTDDNKIERLRFCLSKIKQNGFFPNMMNEVHIDEKWFFLTTNKKSYYVGINEEVPQRSCKSKRFITKVMFMAAVARLSYDYHRKQFFDGKIGIWPFVYQEPAKRNSKNRAKGTIVTKPIESVNSNEYKKMMKEKVFPAIREKFPSSYKQKIIIQQDNAKPHSKETDAELLSEANKKGWKMRLQCQPPNSPDLNVLDLGFFNSIQSLQHQSAPKTIDELIDCVQVAFDKLNNENLNNIFLTLQKCMEATMTKKGGNNYKLPHVGKTRLRNSEMLPEAFQCSQEAIDIANQALSDRSSSL